MTPIRTISIRSQASEQARFSAGPPRLTMMPAEQIAALDPYMAQIITYRKSGLSLNHIIGCPLNCGYCVRHFWGDFEHKTPHLLCSTEEAIGLLLGHEAFRPTTIPIQLFNKATEPFLPAVKPHLFQILTALDKRGLDNLVLVLTRFKVTADDMAVLESLRHVRVTLLFTYSGITDPRVEPIAKSAITTSSIAIACGAQQQTKVVLYWRPIVPGWNDQPETMGHVLRVGKDADAIVFTGYYHKPENAAYLRSMGVHVPYEREFNRRKMLPGDLDARVVSAWRESGIGTPLFRKTSCGVSAAQGVADYNGHWGVRELCDICPVSQTALCRAAHARPTSEQFEAVMAGLGYSSDYLIEDGHVWTHGLGEQRRYAIQHTLGFQIWELDQPHLLHAHGRSLTGYQPTEPQRQHLAAVRERFTRITRFDEDD
jgi:DNA repair photolyase